ncbi:Uncharacterized protein DBV15_11162 [Temnothorax longispinosus]|uniref:Uncharacterized protein n=1 Tax=Temnothorax longispinosus TaxID=300112 RepID=A0A4S2L7S5_9HYME|nr:Uncharacterized protein DBV15_11162 [Temnothorax longispinosus]
MIDDLRHPLYPVTGNVTQRPIIHYGPIRTIQNYPRGVPVKDDAYRLGLLLQDNDGHYAGDVRRVSSYWSHERYGIGRETHPAPVREATEDQRGVRGILLKETWLTPLDLGDNDVIANDIMQLGGILQPLEQLGWMVVCKFLRGNLACQTREDGQSVRSHAAATVAREGGNNLDRESSGWFEGIPHANEHALPLARDKEAG